MEQKKLTIQVEDKQGKFPQENQVEVLFNPNQVTFQKTSTWRGQAKAGSDTRKEQFTAGEPITLSLELMCDTYTYPYKAKTKNKDKLGDKDVRRFTREIYHLTTVEKHGNLHRPPLCRIQWGTFHISDEFQCEWVLQSLNQRFTLFLADGTPVRAVLSCTFRQWRGDKLEALLADKKSADVTKTRIVRRGDTLSNIAAEELDDPTLWRVIAEANHIDNPRNMAPLIGRPLIIPALRKEQQVRK